jgi:uncharacterized delta-60 repeat protein
MVSPSARAPGRRQAGTAQGRGTAGPGSAGGPLSALRRRPRHTFNGNGKRTLGFPGGSVTGTAVALQPNGKVVVAGTFRPTCSAGAGTFALARFNADGALDTGFGTGSRMTIAFGFPGGNQQASAVAVQADGKIVVGGSVSTTGTGDHDFALARLTPAGVLDG